MPVSAQTENVAEDKAKIFQGCVQVQGKSNLNGVSAIAGKC